MPESKTITRRSGITQERLKELFHYDPDTGLFTRLTVSGHRGRYQPGTAVGSTIKSCGYVTIWADDMGYRAHRLAWLYCYGEFPSTGLDHIDGQRDNNRIANLRLANHAQNGQNLRRAQKNSTSGLLGAHWHKQCSIWTAHIALNGKMKHLGCFKTAEAAHAAYLEAKVKLHPFQTLVAL